MYDSIIIGAGVSGCAVARELSRYQGRFLVLEKNTDLCEGSSKANSGIVHGGYDAQPGSLKAKFNVWGNKKMPGLAKDLDIPFVQSGSLVLATTEEGRAGLEELLEQGLANGVEGLEILDREEILQREPQVADEVRYGLYCSVAGIVDPFLLTIALGENAAVNGVDFHLAEGVTNIKKEDGFYTVTTEKATYQTKTIVNAAGVYADELSLNKDFSIRARAGEYFLLDKEIKGYVKRPLFQLPTERGKGVLVTPAVDGNVLLGPTSVFRDDKEDTAVTQEGLDFIRQSVRESVKNPPLNKVITVFTGLRARGSTGDFIIGEKEANKGFYECSAIESPGLTAAAAIGEYLADQIAADLALEENQDFQATRQGQKLLKNTSYEDWQEKIDQDPRYGHMICRCEKVTEGEIIEAVHRPLGARTLDGLKRRTRSGAGRCQAGFCTPQLMEILARESGQAMEDILKNESRSKMVIGRLK